MVGRDQDSILEQGQLAVGVTRGGDDLPTMQAVAVLDELGIEDRPDERPEELTLLEQLLRHLVRDPVAPEPAGEVDRPLLVLPRHYRLRGVEASLHHPRSGEIADICRGAEVIGMEVRHEDRRDGAGQLRELGSPQLRRVGQAKAGVDEHETVVDREQVTVHVPGPRRQRHRHAPQTPGKLFHQSTLTRILRPARAATFSTCMLGLCDE